MKYFSALLCLSLFACTNHKDTRMPSDTSGIEVIHVDVNSVEFSTDISPFLEDDVDIVALETNEECLISAVKKIEFYKNNILISDRTTQKLYRFDSSGKFLNSVGEVGAGPEEYVSLGDFNVVDDLIYLQDESSDKIVVYSFDSRFIKVLDHSPIYFKEFVHIGNKLFFVTNYIQSSLGFYNIYEMDLSTKKINGFAPYDETIELEQQKWGLNRYISKGKDSALAIFSNSNLIYNISESGVIPEYKVHFSERVLPEEEKKKGGTHAMMTALSKGYILGLDNMYNAEDYLFFSFSDGSEGRDFFYDKINKKGYLSEWLFVNRLGHLYGTDCITSNNEFAIIQPAYLYRDLWERHYTQFEIESDKDRKRMLDIYNSILEDDNPVIFRFKFKRSD